MRVALLLVMLIPCAVFPQDTARYKVSGIITTGRPATTAPSAIRNDYSPRLAHLYFPMQDDAPPLPLVLNLFSAVFRVPEAMLIDVSLYADDGKHMKTLLSDGVPAGDYLFSFSKTPLQRGRYMLKVTGAKNAVLYQAVTEAR
jgi:hypothetical protein